MTHHKTRQPLWLVAALAALTAPPLLAQRGMGDESGIAQWDTLPPTTQISGRVSDLKIAECKSTTGKADLGAHVFLDTDDGRTLNVHMGPYDVLESLVADLEDGTEVSATAFRTDAMPEDHYVAVTVNLAGTETTLRNPDTLRPTWSTELQAGAGQTRQAGEGASRRGEGPGAAERGNPRLRGRGPSASEDCWWQPPRRGDRGQRGNR